MATSRLWRQVVTETIRDEFPQLMDKLSHQLVDSAAMLLAKDPRKLNGVVLTENVSATQFCPEFNQQQLTWKRHFAGAT